MKNLNLLPSENKKNNREKIILKKMITLEVIIFLSLILIVVTLRITNGIIKDKVSLVESSMSEDSSAGKDIKESLQVAEIINKDLNEISNITLDEQINIKHFISVISKQIPSKVYISKLDLSSIEKFFYLECVSEKSDGSSEFIKRLNDSGNFKEISLVSIEISNAENEFFSLELYYGDGENE